MGSSDRFSPAVTTDAGTGAHDTKPAHWVDANIHAIEVTGGVAALHLIHHLVSGFGSDPTVTEALRTRTFYVAPRVNPDGVEWEVYHLNYDLEGTEARTVKSTGLPIAKSGSCCSS